MTASECAKLSGWVIAGTADGAYVLQSRVNRVKRIREDGDCIRPRPSSPNPTISQPQLLAIWVDLCSDVHRGSGDAESSKHHFTRATCNILRMPFDRSRSIMCNITNSIPCKILWNMP